MTIARAARLYRTRTNKFATSNETKAAATTTTTTTALSGESLTCQALCQHCYNLATFGEKSLRLNAYAKIFPLERILIEARQSDERMREGRAKSHLDGIPVTIKANIAVGRRWWEMPHACSRILTSHSFWDEEEEEEEREDDSIGQDDETGYESDIARRLLRDCGAVLIGITNMDEFGMGSLGAYNGLPDAHSNLQRRYSPAYNPLPWMHRLSLLTDDNLHSRHVGNMSSEQRDEHWLHQIHNSTPDNPHGVADLDGLQQLLEEIDHWIKGGGGGGGGGGDDINKKAKLSPLLSPGGSSSGAAATVSHGSSLLSLGTDTGGSLRLPAAWTSSVGFKPTYGRFSRYGVVSYASSLDTVGFVARTAECAQIAYDSLSGNFDGRETGSQANENIKWDGQQCLDPTAMVYQHTPPSTHKNNSRSNNNHTTQATTTPTTLPLHNLRVGIPAAFSLHETPPLLSCAWSDGARILEQLGGATLVPISESLVSPQLVKLACAAYYVLACAEASSNLSRYDGIRYGFDFELGDSNGIPNGDDDSFKSNHYPALMDMNLVERQISATRVHGFGDEVQRRILAGTAVLSSDKFHTHYEAAAMVRARLSRSLEKVLRSGPLDEVENKKGEDEQHEQEQVDVMLVPTALSFPCTLEATNDDPSKAMNSTAAFANDVMTIPVSLGGFPSVSVPVQVRREEGKEEIRPTDVAGLQIFGARGCEEVVLKVARLLDVNRR